MLDNEKSDAGPTRPDHTYGQPDLSFDRLGYKRGEDGRAVPVDPAASRLLTRIMDDVALTFKKLDAPSLK